MFKKSALSRRNEANDGKPPHGDGRSGGFLESLTKQMAVNDHTLFNTGPIDDRRSLHKARNI